ncbi:transcription factor [Asimina triloba]
MDGLDLHRVSSLRRNSSSVWRSEPHEAFSRSTRREEDDEVALRWAALEKLPTYDRLRKGILNVAPGDLREVDIQKLGYQEKKILLDRLLKVAEEDNEKFLLKLRNRIDQVGIDLPTIEVRFEHLNIDADAYVGSRALPTFFNFTINAIEGLLNYIGLLSSRKTTLSILQDVTGIIEPGRLTLLLGPPASGKTTLLLALAGKLDPDLKVAAI